MYRVLDVARQAGNRRYESLMLGNLAQVLTDQGKFEQAEPAFQRALQLCRETGNRTSEGLQLVNLGSLYRCTGRDEQAEPVLQQAYEVLRSIGNRYLEAWALGQLACTRMWIGDIPGARADYARAREMTAELGVEKDLAQLERAWAEASEHAGQKP